MSTALSLVGPFAFALVVHRGSGWLIKPQTAVRQEVELREVAEQVLRGERLDAA